MTQPQMDGEQWLSAALAGGLPEPSRSRWQPLRVGIVNLWEYDNAEFWFADGRLVLRGGNGAGKTKVLELTTLMLLRGEITASVLDPFGSQHRTMRFNLLPSGEGDDPRPAADSGLGYAWAEFGRRDDHGQAHYFVCGLGASAKRGTGTSGVTTWQLLTHLRPGRDFHLSAVNRTVDQKELKKIDGVTVLDNATRYRARLGSELFGLGPDAYDNLTELLKQLRKPKLGERLNPASLAETLRAALPPLATNEINQLADGWDRLELLRQVVEQTKNAALQLAQFVRSGWLPWARIVVRRRADALSSATTELDNTTKARRLAETALDEANAEVKRVESELSGSRSQYTDLTTELREMLDSQAFKDAISAAQRVESLRSESESLRGQLGRAKQRARELSSAVAKASAAVEVAQDEVNTAQRTADERLGTVESQAEPAGLTASVQRHLPLHDLAALRADLTVRVERFDELRKLHRTFSYAEREADKSAQAVRDRSEDVEDAAEQEAEAHQIVEAAVDNLRQQIREWAAATTIARTTDEQVETWCDVIAELTVTEPDEPIAHRQISPTTMIRAHLDAVREALRGEREALRRKRDPLTKEQDELTGQLADVRGQTERPPPPPVLWRRQQRPDLDSALGAPLWQCVQPVDGLRPEQLDLLEATLAASGLLDSWLTPDGSLYAVDGVEPLDVQLYPRSNSGVTDTLAGILAPTSAGGVPDPVIHSVLSGIGWHDARPVDDQLNAWLAADGSWRVGPLTGRAGAVQPASYLGATAREAAREREIMRLETRLAELKSLIDTLDLAIDGITDDLATLDSEARRVPPERPVTDAVTTWRERQTRLLACRQRLTSAQLAHQQKESAKDAAWAAYGEYAGRYAFPLEGLEEVATALHTYRGALSSLESALELLGAQQAALGAAQQTLTTQQDLLSHAEAEVRELAEQVRKAEVRLRTAEEALRADHMQQLRRRDLLDESIRKLGDEIGRLADALSDAKVRASKAEDTLGTHEDRRQAAEQSRDAALEAWWEVFDAGLAQPLGLTEPERRGVETARETTRTVRREIMVTADAVSEDRAWRRCYAQLEELRHNLLPNRDARVLDDIDEAPIQKVVILADSGTGWQAPHEASEALAMRVREQEATFDEEQQRVLTTLLGSTFIEHLKDRLDYTEWTFSDINKQLAAHPTRHGHAVRLRWEADPTDPDAGAVVTALSQGYQQLGTQRQEMVRSFLARKIDAARADASADGAADWKEQLSSALDYRSWLRISLQYRPGSGSAWAPFDAAKHGAKSGGEKVVLLSQPLFAAAVVAYNAASDTAPRWVWLDEAMTGVDAGIKASFMGLTVDFDLDVMLTAHDEWCQYPTVPAVAVYDLARQEHLPGVDAMPFLWCGGEWTQVSLPATTSARTEDPRKEEGLFALLDVD
jgi:uncharacterized protein (TIGR02680 family)